MNLTKLINFGHIHPLIFVIVVHFRSCSNIKVCRCEFFGHVQIFQSFSFGHLESVNWLFLYLFFLFFLGEGWSICWTMFCCSTNKLPENPTGNQQTSLPLSRHLHQEPWEKIDFGSPLKACLYSAKKHSSFECTQNILYFPLWSYFYLTTSTTPIE